MENEGNPAFKKSIIKRWKDEKEEEGLPTAELITEEEDDEPPPLPPVPDNDNIIKNLAKRVDKTK